MKKAHLLLFAAFAATTTTLTFAQENLEAPTESKDVALTLLDNLKLASTLPEVASLEVQYSDTYEGMTQEDASKSLKGLVEAYRRALPGDPASAAEVLLRYTPDWETSISLAVKDYYRIAGGIPAQHQLRASLAAAATPEAVDLSLANFFSKNLYPERLSETGLDSRDDDLLFVLRYITEAAVRVRHPMAVNFAITYYREIPINFPEGVELSIELMASALKSMDLSLFRANLWIESQNTGSPVVDFTPEELELPEVLSVVEGQLIDPADALVSGTEAFIIATTSENLDVAIYEIANALKAHDLNLARANAWIESQKNGTEFDLTLDQ